MYNYKKAETSYLQMYTLSVSMRMPKLMNFHLLTRERCETNVLIIMSNNVCQIMY